MQLAYLTFTLVLGIFMSLIWNSKDMPNFIIKVGFICWTIWTGVMMAGTLAPMINNGALRLI